MNPRPLALLACLAALALAARAADAPPAEPAPANPGAATPASDTSDSNSKTPPPSPPKHQATVAEIRARLLEHLRKKNEPAQVTHPAEQKNNKPAAAAAAQPAPAKPSDTAPDPNEPTKVLPKVEVKQMPITELDVKVARQNREIAAEKKNTEPTALDETLNGKKVSRFFSFLGGQSSDQRASVASERVAIMEQERDLIEAIAEAQTKEDKAELEKALADLRQTRRELEQSLR
jgi:hypothetical protein